MKRIVASQEIFEMERGSVSSSLISSSLIVLASLSFGAPTSFPLTSGFCLEVYCMIIIDIRDYEFTVWPFSL